MAAQKARKRRSAPQPIDEVMASSSGEITRCARRAADHACLLESIGSLVVEMTCEVHKDSSSPELLRRARGIRGLVVHALGVLADLQCEAGRLDALAMIKGEQNKRQRKSSP
jgi:hypothetical protein